MLRYNKLANMLFCDFVVNYSELEEIRRLDVTYQEVVDSRVRAFRSSNLTF
jgi:prepilin-type processing-associated H-X9-DG protein